MNIKRTLKSSDAIDRLWPTAAGYDRQDSTQSCLMKFAVTLFTWLLVAPEGSTTSSIDPISRIKQQVINSTEEPRAARGFEAD